MKKRQANFELLRILCMYMIVLGHCLFHGRVTAKLGYGTTNYFLSYLIQSFSVVHVNCFVMLAGYFAIDGTFRMQRPLKIWKQVFFYGAVICLFAGLTVGVEGKDVLLAVFPISARNYWFASVYMGLVFLMPFLGMTAVRLTKKQYQYLLLLLALFLSVNHMFFRVDTYGTYTGRDLPWFVFLALLAGYIKLHTEEMCIRDRHTIPHKKGLPLPVLPALPAPAKPQAKSHKTDHPEGMKPNPASQKQKKDAKKHAHPLEKPFLMLLFKVAQQQHISCCRHHCCCLRILKFHIQRLRTGQYQHH